MNQKANKLDLPKMPSHIKDESHVNLDTLLSELRLQKFYGRIEVHLVNGQPYKVVKVESLSLTSKSIDQLRSE